MNIYISLLRGINVSGNNKILMKDLKSLYEKIGFTDVITYIQSGNVVFKSELAKNKVKQCIESAISTEFNLTISVLIEIPKSLKKTLKNCTFLTDSNLNQKNIYFCFLSEVPKNLSELENSNYGGASFKNYNNILYLYYPNGAGKTKLTNNFIEKKLNLIATSRNLNTLIKLIKLSN